MQLEFFGAAGEVTGSCHVLRVGGGTLLLDYGGPEAPVDIAVMGCTYGDRRQISRPGLRVNLASPADVRG